MCITGICTVRKCFFFVEKSNLNYNRCILANAFFKFDLTKKWDTALHSFYQKGKHISPIEHQLTTKWLQLNSKDSRAANFCFCFPHKIKINIVDRMISNR